ncbi:Transcription factor UNE10 [Camellia lanceoleosa]|uniref:Transcription factor UNE10 n=1 Tax=Camellia lanceoleosa TaxID=1840588 RepID=A0ACC0IFB6_9ERIC|nr:Transcription factor UNE10 [Camellia lanceoleosa]
MSQCVPSWDMDENHTPPTLTLRAHSNSNSSCPDVPLLDYEVTELTWKNGQLAMHGLGPPRVPNKQPLAAAKYPWEKPRAGGTLESIVDQATTTCFPHPKTTAAASDLVPWFDHRAASASSSAATAAVTMDALVPCSTAGAAQEGISTCVIGRSTRVGSCSEVEEEEKKKRARVAHVQEWSSRDNSDRRQLAIDTCERELGVRGLTSTSMENTSSGKHWTKVTAGDDHDSVSHSRSPIEAGEEENKKKPTGKSSISTKRCRAAAVHNQSERKRRDKINQRMKTLQKMVPNSSKTDKASMLDEVIEYLKVLQAQVQMMSRMNMPMPSMMFPMALQQQLQLSMMAPMGMGMGMGMGMDMNTIGRPNAAGIPPILHPTAAFMPLTSWDGIGDRLVPHPTVMPDPMATFLSCQSQPMNMEAYNRMAALYQQLHQPPPPPPPKNN